MDFCQRFTFKIQRSLVYFQCRYFKRFKKVDTCVTYVTFTPNKYCLAKYVQYFAVKHVLRIEFSGEFDYTCIVKLCKNCQKKQSPKPQIPNSWYTLGQVSIFCPKIDCLILRFWLYFEIKIWFFAQKFKYFTTEVRKASFLARKFNFLFLSKFIFSGQKLECWPSVWK